MKNKLIPLLIVVLGLQSCVMQKEVYTSELSKNFEDQKVKFIEKRGIEKESLEDFKVYYSDQKLDKEYEVVSYNQVNSWIPFRPFIFKKWEVKYRLHQYMHNAYCWGILPTIDAMIVNEDLSGVKYIRYKDSKKESFQIPQKQETQSGFILGGGIQFPLDYNFNNGKNYVRPIIAPSYYLKRDINCLKSIRQEFGLLVKPGYTYNDTIYNYSVEEKSQSAFFALNYKFIFSYNISEYFSNTWNKGGGKFDLKTEVGLDAQVFNFNPEKTTTTIIGTSNVSTDKIRNKSLLIPGIYAGLTYQTSSNFGINIGASIYPFSLFNYDKTISSSSNSSISNSKTKSKQVFRYNDFLPKLYLRVLF